MFVVDTNVLLFAVRHDAPEHKICSGRLDGWRKGSIPWYLTWGIIYEFMRVSTHARVFERPLTGEKAWAFLEALLESPSFSILLPTGRHSAIFQSVLADTPGLSGNLWHDAETAALMREHGIRRIYTRDSDFFRFRFLEPLDPLARLARNPAQLTGAPRMRRTVAVFSPISSLNLGHMPTITASPGLMLA